jgi:hypothetical protein
MNASKQLFKASNYNKNKRTSQNKIKQHKMQFMMIAHSITTHLPPSSIESIFSHTVVEKPLIWEWEEREERRGERGEGRARRERREERGEREEREREERERRERGEREERRERGEREEREERGKRYVEEGCKDVGCGRVGCGMSGMWDVG